MGARPGDALVLTKALGTGIVTTAHKHGKASAADGEAAIASMLALNAAASRTLREFAVHACTDVTGFSLLGHGFEMAHGSGVRVGIEAARLPSGPGGRGLAAAGELTGGCRRSQEWLADRVQLAPDVPTVWWSRVRSEDVGGLLAAIPPRRRMRRSPRSTRPAWRWRRSWARCASAATVWIVTTEPRAPARRRSMSAHRHRVGRRAGRRWRLASAASSSEFADFLGASNFAWTASEGCLLRSVVLICSLHLVEGRAPLLAIGHEDQVPAVLRLDGIAQLARQRNATRSKSGTIRPVELAEIAALRSARLRSITASRIGELAQVGDQLGVQSASPSPRPSPGSCDKRPVCVDEEQVKGFSS